MADRDLSFEMLAESTGIDWRNLTASARGPLVKALKEIRSVSEGLEDHELATVIQHKAKIYSKVYEGAALTPTALAKHWPSLEQKWEEMQTPTTYVSHDRLDCTTCGGLRMVLAYTTPAPKPIPGHELEGYEAYSPCPDCNPKALAIANTYRERFDRFHPSDKKKREVPKEAKDLLSKHP